MQVEDSSRDSLLFTDFMKNMAKGKKPSGAAAAQQQRKSSAPTAVADDLDPEIDQANAENVGAETIDAIKEYHGHNRYDINKLVIQLCS